MACDHRPMTAPVALAARRAVADQLAPGERLLWEGSPDASHWLYSSDRTLIPFSVYCAGVATLMLVEVLVHHQAGRGLEAFLAGLFVLVGAYLLVGRLVVRRWARSRTAYAVTDRRVVALYLTLRGRSHIRSLWLDPLPPVSKRVHSNGTGSIFIGSFFPMERAYANDGSWPGANLIARSNIVFADIPTPNEAYSLITAQRDQT